MISRSSLLLKRLKESERKSAQRDARRSTGIVITIEARDRQKGAIAMINMTEKGPGIETATEAGTIAPGSTILTRMATGTSGLDTQKEMAKTTRGSIDTDTGTVTRLEIRSQASLRLRIRRRSFLYQTKSCLEMRLPLWRETPG